MSRWLCMCSFLATMRIIWNHFSTESEGFHFNWQDLVPSGILISWGLAPVPYHVVLWIHHLLGKREDYYNECVTLSLSRQLYAHCIDYHKCPSSALASVTQLWTFPNESAHREAKLGQESGPSGQGPWFLNVRTWAWILAPGNIARYGHMCALSWG